MVVVGVDVVLITVGSAVLVLVAGFTVPEVRFNPLGAGPKLSFLINVCLSSFLLNNTEELPLGGVDVEVVIFMISTSGKLMPSSSDRIWAGRASTKLVMLFRSSTDVAANSYLNI